MRSLLLAIIVLLMCSLVSCVNTNPNVESSTENGIINNDPSEDNMKNEIIYSNMDDILSIMNSNDEYIIVDVRTFEEYCEGHIPGAINIPNENIVDKQPELLPDKDALILIYCRSGNRSKQAAQKLLDMGYTNLVEFGGIIDWNGKIVVGESPFEMVVSLRMPMPDVLTYKIKLPKLLGKD